MPISFDKSFIQTCCAHDVLVAVSLMVYRLPTAIACQLQQSFPTVYSLPTATACQLPQSLPAATEPANGTQLANCRTARQLPQLASYHRAFQRYTACQLPRSSLMVYRS